MTEAQPGGDRRPRVSVIVLAYNEEANLPDCLASLDHLDCEVLVVDSGSTDGTREIARRAGATVFDHPFETYGAQRKEGMIFHFLQGFWFRFLIDAKLFETRKRQAKSVAPAPR